MRRQLSSLFRFLATALILVLPFQTVSQAKEPSNSKSGQNASTQAQSSSTSAQSADTSADEGYYRVEGKVKDTSRTRIRGGSRFLVTVERPDGKLAKVDIGGSRRFWNLRLREGESFSAQGLPARIGDDRILLAESFKSGDRSHQVNRDVEQVRGTVIEMKYAPLRVSSSNRGEYPGTDHFLVLVKTERDREVWIDLGPSCEITDFVVGQGDEISVSGPTARDKKGQVVVAQELRRGGERFALGTPAERSAARQASRAGTTIR